MNPDLMKKLLDIIAAGDAAAALALLPEIVSGAAGGGAAPDAGPPSVPGDGPPMGAAPAAGAAAPEKKDDAPMARENARVATVDAEVTRARSAATSLVSDAIRARIHNAREIDGIAIAPATEKRMLAASSVEAASSILDTIRETIESSGGAVRARSGAKPPGGKVGSIEGMTSRERATYAGLVDSNPRAAEQYADECGKTRARVAAKGGAK